MFQACLIPVHSFTYTSCKRPSSEEQSFEPGIDQVDPEIMEQGVYGLGAFLKASAELRILWSDAW